MGRPLHRLPLREATHEMFEALGILVFALGWGIVLTIMVGEALA